MDHIDVSENIAVQNWAYNVYKKFESIDIIINNAGVKSELKPMWEINVEDFDQTIKINVLGIANIIRNFVPKMVKNQKGIILNLTSEWGRYADPYVSSYCASKFAVEGLTQSLAKELPKGMASIALNPYFVRGNLLESCKKLFLPGEYELSILPDEWARFSVPRILGLDSRCNGKSVTIHPLAPEDNN